MGYRLSKIYTRTGDKGTTGMAGGERIEKDSARVAAIGDMDELNCHIGLVISEQPSAELKEILLTIQHDLFNVGGELCMPEHSVMTEQRVVWLEDRLDELNENLPPLLEFILPGGGKAASQCQLARAMCRRTERSIVGLAREMEINNAVKAYVNRLSDLLFVLCRVLSREAGEDEVYWKSERLAKLEA